MAEITAALVKELREKTGVGMMDCKNALKETNGDMEKAADVLRKKGIAKAAKRADRVANEGVVEAYIHPGSKLGVLVEVNCETDFVANTDDFKQFARNVAMHIAATNPVAISREEVDQTLLEKETEIYKEQARAEGKPDNIVEKIAHGRLEKYFTENVLLDQAYVKEPEKSIQDLLTETIAKVGEKVTINHFSRFKIGG
jgi:elongation factor Ts